jgi:uncharacterized Zn finger protein
MRCSADGDLDTAWSTAEAASWDSIGRDLWSRLAEAREPARPADALAIYQRVADDVLEATDRRAYRSAAQILTRARGAARAAGMPIEFDEHLARIRERHRRRPTLIAILDKADLR